jgi:dynein heavy chain, axonemal
MRTFLDIPADEYESCSKSEVFKKLIFATAFFNALILERRKFGAVGWNIPYEWMNSDLKTGMNQVKMYVEEQDDVPWETLNVQVADITYGGGVPDTWDKRAISSILRKYFAPDVLKDDFRFTEDGVYYAPPHSDIQLSGTTSAPCLLTTSPMCLACTRMPPSPSSRSSPDL